MNTLKLTLSKLFFSCLAVLFSVSFFSFKSHAAEKFAYSTNDLPLDIAYNNSTYRYVSISISDGYFVSFYVSNDFIVPVFISSHSTGNNGVYVYSQGNNYSPTTQNLTSRFNAIANSDYFYYQGYGLRLSTNNLSVNSHLYTFNSLQELLVAYEGFVPEPDAPEYDDFGLKGFNYVTSVNSNTLWTNDIYQLTYKLDWDGSTNPDYPITRVDYELYGFYDLGMDNTDKSNGVLVDSGEAFDGMSYDVYSHVKNWIGTTDFKKFVFYLIPFSGKTEGNTQFIVCNCYTSEVELNFGPIVGIGLDIGDMFGITATYGTGTIDVPYTSTVNNGENSAGVASIDGVPVLTIVPSISGSFNNYTQTHIVNNNYSPVIYGDTTEINNYYDDHSSSITNNTTVNNIINNFNGSVDIDPDSEGYANNIISFLTMLITFFSTFWSYCVVALGWLPGWVQVFVSAMFGLLGTITVGLGILKFLKGVF